MTSSNLREPLFLPPVKGINKIKRSNQNTKTPNQYLPPYRYDDNETTFNIYTSVEAYSIVAKTLLCEYEIHKDDFEPYDIVIRTLSISQIKMFADAHMEKALTLPTFQDPGEPLEMTLLRRIDLHFRDVLLEFYASENGILLRPQIDELRSKAEKLKDATKRHENVELHEESFHIDNCIKNINTNDCNSANISSLHSHNDVINNQESNESKVPYSAYNGTSNLDCTTGTNNDKQSTLNQSHFETNSDTLNKDESRQLQYESDFDRIYNSENEEDNPTQRLEVRDCDETDRSSNSRLRQEILSEIGQLKSLIKNTSSDLEKKRYKTHLTSLIDELDTSRNINSKMKSEAKRSSKANIDRNISKVDSCETAPGKDGFFQNGSIEFNEDEDRDIFDSPGYEKDIHSRRHFDIDRSDREAYSPTMSADKEKIIHQSRGFVHINDVEKGFQFVRLIAHEDLKDGCLFQAKYRQRYFTIRVPGGGIKRGEVFSSPVLHPSGEKNNVVTYESLLDGMEIPRGGWRDKFFHCCNDPMFFMSCFCPNGKSE